MTAEELKKHISGIFPSVQFEEGKEITTVIAPDALHDFMKTLKTDSSLEFDFMYSLTGIDWGIELGVVYHLESTTKNHKIVVKANAKNRDNAELESVCSVWEGAMLQELEVYDLIGISFKNHPKLRRFMMPDNWVGHPLRKDYKDERIVEL